MEIDPLLLKKAQILKSTPLFSSLFDDQPLEKQNIFLVLAGLKPTAQVNSSHMEEVGDHKRISKPDNENDVIKLLTELGLEYEILRDEYFTGAYISLSKDELKKLANKIYDPNNREGFHKEAGLSFGYPKTAVDAFISGNTLDPVKQEQLLKENGIESVLCFFFLSKDNYLEEINIIKNWQNTLEKYGLFSKKRPFGD